MRKVSGWVWLTWVFILIGSLSVAEEEIPSDIPKTDLDLYLEQHRIELGPKLVVPPLDWDDRPDFKPITMSDLPDFSADVEKKVTKKGKVNENGLLSTINFEEYEGRKVNNELKLKLPPELTGFTGEIKVRTVWQPKKAPLAVMLLGFGQKADDKNARSWQADLYKAGNHVLSFDSIVRNDMNRATSHGVAGNIMLEGERCAQIIASVLRMKDEVSGEIYGERVSSVRLAGFSYGGALALQVLRVPKAKDWPVDRALIVSTPVDLLRTSELLDLYYWADQTHFSTFSLARLLEGFTPEDEEPSERELSLLRAGLGYVFHGDVSDIFEDNMKRYMPNMVDHLKTFSASADVKAHREKELARLKKNNERALADLEAQKDQLSKDEYKERRRNLKEDYESKEAYASTEVGDIGEWSFKHGRYLMVRPYWDIRNNMSDYGRLKELLKGAPNFVQVVISEDDPLNVPDDVEAFKATVKEPQLLLLPHGGHLGLSGTQWFQALMAKFFAAK